MTNTKLFISKRQTAEVEFLPFAGKINVMLNLSNPSHVRQRNVHSRLIRIIYIYITNVKFVYQMKNAQYKEPVKDAAIS